MTFVTVLTSVAIGMALLSLGRLVLGPASGLIELACRVLAGMVVLHFALTVLDLAGVSWHPLGLWVLLLTAIAVAVGLALSSGARRPKRGLGGRESIPAVVVTVATVGAFGWSAWTLRSVAPDFVYHWGIKAKRYAIARGVDWDYLSRSWNDFVQPDYPNLFPDLYSLGALLTGRFEEHWPMTVSVVLFAAIVTTTYALLDRIGDMWLQVSGLVLVGCACAAFSIGYFQAGGIDLGLALAGLLGLWLLLPSSGDQGDNRGGLGRKDRALALGFVCAFAAASKIEGVSLAAWLVLAYCVTFRPRLTELVRLGAPLALVVLPWAFELMRRDLFQRSEAAELTAQRLWDVLQAIPQGFAQSSWHGLSWLVILAPALLVSGVVRPIGTVMCLQLTFFLWVYWRSPVEPTFYVLSSWPRLVFQLWPAVVVGLLLAAARSVGAEGTSEELPADLRESPLE